MIKVIVSTIINKIIFNKKLRSDYKSHMTFIQEVIDILNEKVTKEPTVKKNTVGSFYIT